MGALLGDDAAPVPEWQRRADSHVDRALRTLSWAFDMSSTNPKPVLLHSARVAMLLRGLGYGRDVQVAGALHDIIEDTAYPLHDIAHDFGDEVAVLVMANSEDAAIEDWTERYQEAYPRCIAWGASAAVIKAADLYDNAPYADTAWLAKPRCFLELSREIIGEEPIYKLLQERVDSLAAAFDQGRELT